MKPFSIEERIVDFQEWRKSEFNPYTRHGGTIRLEEVAEYVNHVVGNL